MKRFSSITENIKVGHVVLFVLLLHLLILDYFIFSSYRQISSLFSENQVFVDAISSIDFSENALGLSSLFEEKLPPTYLAAIHQLYAIIITQIHRLRIIDNQIIFDTSSNMETSIILARIAERHFPIQRLVVDVGAMDGISGSNSFNYIALGWNAVLVEPYPPHARSIERNLDLYIRRLYQNISVVEGVVSDFDGMRMMTIFSDNSKTSNTIVPTKESNAEIITVKSYTPKTLSEMYHIPTNFGVLTVDAEGFDVIIVHQFMKAGFRPSYIVMETRLLPKDQTDSFLSGFGYNCIAKVGSNVIWEHV